MADILKKIKNHAEPHERGAEVQEPDCRCQLKVKILV